MHMILSAIPLLVPLLIDIAAIWSWRGGYRYVAIIPLPFLVLAFAVDLNSMIQGGNLTGLFTLFAAVPTLLLLLVVSAVQGFSAPAAKSVHRPSAIRHLPLVLLTLVMMVIIGLVVFMLLPVS